LTILPVHPYFLPGNKHSEKAASEKPSLRRTREELRGLISDLLAKQGNMSANEIAYALGYKTLNNTVRAVVNDMLKSGEVTYLYPDKPNSRNQKICITRENESSD
jgi:ATP-dependent DNA helicase RecG